MEIILGQTYIFKAFSKMYFCDKNAIQNEFFIHLRVDSKWLLQMNSPFLTYIQDSHLREMGHNKITYKSQALSGQNT